MWRGTGILANLPGYPFERPDSTKPKQATAAQGLIEGLREGAVVVSHEPGHRQAVLTGLLTPRGLPLGFAAGITNSINSHCSSDKSLGYGLRATASIVVLLKNGERSIWSST